MARGSPPWELKKMGRKPKPTALHVLNGNPSKIKDLGKREAKPEPVAPNKPAWLKGNGAKMWKRLSPKLERLGLLTSIDGEAFAAACHSWGVFVECQRYLKKHGMTYEYTNKAGEVNTIARPEVKIGQKALDQFKGFCTEFGLTPAARTRIEVKAPEVEKDPLEGILSGVK